MISALKITADRMALCGVASPMTLSAPSSGQRGDEQRRDDGEVLRHVVGDGEGGQRAARHQQLLADLDDLDELGRIAVEVDHVAGLARRLRAGLHGDADVGLGQRRRVVGAVAAHGDQPALRLLRADVGAACPRGVASAMKSSTPASEAMAAAVTGLSPVTITVRMPMRRSSAKRSLMSGLTTSFRWMTPSRRPPSVEAERRAARAGDAVDGGAECRRLGDAAAPRRAGELQHGVDRALAQLRAAEVDAGQARRRREGDEAAPAGATPAWRARYFSCASVDDGAALRRLVGEAGQQRRLGRLALGHAGHGDDLASPCGCRR